MTSPKRLVGAPSYPITTADLVAYIGAYVDSQVSSEASTRSSAISAETTARNAAISAAIAALGDLATQAELDAVAAAKQSVSEKGQANGYASLDGSGLVPSAQLPPAQSGSSNVFIQEAEPDQGADAWVWMPIDGTGTWDGTTHVYSPGVPTAPTFTVDPAITGTGVVGDTLTCDGGTATGTATIVKTYQWKNAGVAISGETASTYVVAAGDVGDALTCTVTASNGVSPDDTATSNAITGLATPTAPGAPTSLILTPGDTEIDAAWTAPASNGGSAITTYLVEYRTPAGSGSYTTFVHGASTTPSITITGLTNDSEYGVQVSAVNAIGTGSPTAEGTATPAAAGGLPYTTGLLVDWDADGVAGANNSTPTTIPDASGGSRDGTIAGGTLKTAVAAFNGHNAIDLSGTASSIIHDAASSFVTGATFTLMIVAVKATSVDQTCLAVLHKEGVLDDYNSVYGALVANTLFSATELQNYRAGATRAKLTSFAGDNVPFIYTVAFQADGDDRVRRITSGGTVNATPTTGTTANFDADRLIVGRRFSAGALDVATPMQVARVLLFSGDLAGADQDANEAALATLYGIV